ncbi:MAG: alanine--tRNA ligase [Limnobacter sp. CACIAM 66H1]|uniref:alanine--tRNA ligase n=1 Tax=Limnobacter sp. CACIAM 66H1 TaxID=1813033 RepID=UPI0007A85E1F|nr:alanine--tRNA ligase [Limnobacter sp. CACIAM 66H1]KYP10395.1 MAG: alanine--tRNA ligase [Limnobacter sp. CACIAM 66H1]
MKVADIREKFLDFFASKGHTKVPSSSLVPGNDPTLLFTNSGMVQFKDVFTGKDKRPYTRATSSQRSVRAGGKHNDLENVGYTARHHTFFEMLGNFSFGDYFKENAIQYAWELLTTVYKLPPERLYVTVYQEDDEAYNIWNKQVGVPAERIIRIGDNKGARYASDNFWQMADTGPCGPCTEIFYDHGPEVWGGPPGSPEEDGDRYIEVWNLVFMQFDRSADGVLHPLPKPCVDTGMGLERIAAVLQHVHSNYEIDLFQTLIKAAAREVTAQGNAVDLTNNSLRVIADHIRACSFLVVDGVIPGNEGRGYVLRRIIRRAIRHGYKLGCRKPFFNALVGDLVSEMGEAYPELAKAAAQVQSILKAEEERFFETIENGMAILDSALGALPKGGMLDGETAFKLHDTYGFPLDLTADVCRERDMSVDEAAFDEAMNKQKQQARAAGKFKMDADLAYSGVSTEFKGYDQLEVANAKITAIYVNGTSVNSIAAGQQGVVVLDQTPFYAESGGQVGDQGEISSGSACLNLFRVLDTQKIQANVFGHHGELVTGELKVGDAVGAQVDQYQRNRTIRNHSATHLMHKALREVLGDHVSQKGSLVDAEKTRFDFAHHSAMTPEQIAQVERIVNEEILANAETQARIMDIESAKSAGAMMLFGEKYGDTVRVLDIGSSRELCGGTHVQRTGDIGLFKITSESGVAAGIRRVEATTGLGAMEFAQKAQAQVDAIAQSLRVPAAEATVKIGQIMDQVKNLEKELDRLKSKLAASQGDDLAGQAVDVGGVKVLAAKLEGADVKQLREAADKLRDKLGNAALVLATVLEGKVSLIASVSKEATAKVKAGDLVNFVAQQVGGKGGGRPDMAQAGGTQPENLDAALASVVDWVKNK